MKRMEFRKVGVVLFSALLCSSGCMVYAQSTGLPSVSATGNQSYCPQSSIPVVTDFSITDPVRTGTEQFFVQISEGYEEGFDLLELTGNHPNVLPEWIPEEGKLALRGPGGQPMPYADLTAAVRDIVFRSNSTNPPGEKRFSLTLASANYLPETGHYYEFISDVGISWANAERAAEQRELYGMQGYLATVTTPAEADITGLQARGTGWIGGSDRQTEGVWQWMTGPERGTVFWNGGANGSSPNYANWNTGEPNNLGDEDYAHITDPSVGRPGSWNDLQVAGDPGGGAYQPKGYIVEYGGMEGDPELNLSATTRIYISSINTEVSEIERCGPSEVSLQVNPTGNTNLDDLVIYWFETESSTVPIATGTTFTTSLLEESRDYYVSASENGCLTGPRTRIPIEIHPLPRVPDITTLTNCDEDGAPDGATLFNLRSYLDSSVADMEDFLISYHLSEEHAQTGANPVDGEAFDSSVSDRVYVRLENEFGCFETFRYNLQVTSTALPDGFQVLLQQCDADQVDGIYEFDLREAVDGIRAQLPPDEDLRITLFESIEDALLRLQPIEPNFLYRNLRPNQTLYVRIEHTENESCYGLGPYVQLRIPLVEFDLDESAVVCQGSTVALSARIQTPGDYVYEWLDEAGQLVSVDEVFLAERPGTFSLRLLSEQGCYSPTRDIEVRLSSPPQLDASTVEVLDLLPSNTIRLREELLGPGEYEYSLDSFGSAFQDSPEFNRVEPGFHILTARDKNGCGLQQFRVGVVGAQAYVSPNNDNINDRFELRGLSRDYYASGELYIYDRYGKLLAVIDPFSEGWDGTRQDRNLPSTDYWFRLVLTSLDGEVRVKKGHFSLLR